MHYALYNFCLVIRRVAAALDAAPLDTLILYRNELDMTAKR